VNNTSSSRGQINCRVVPFYDQAFAIEILHHIPSGCRTETTTTISQYIQPPDGPDKNH
jgi:hypothetical protein